MKALFAIAPEWGGYLPALSVARAWVGRGHTACFGGLSVKASHRSASYSEFIERQGFEVVELPRFEAPSRRRLATRLRQVPRMLDPLIDSTEDLIRRSKADLVLIDSTISFVAIAAARLDIPMFGLKTNLLSTPNSYLPPYNSSLLPGPRGFSKLAVRRAWLTYWMAHRWQMLRRPKSIVSDLLMRRIARRHGLRTVFTEVGQRIAIPEELYLLPEAFDFLPVPGRRYVGGSILLDRADTGIGWIEALTDKPIVYCSLGTNALQYRQLYAGCDEFFRQVVEAFRIRPRYNLVIHTGDAFPADALGSLPDNVVVKEWVPQLAVLARADLMITHAGLGAVKECMHSRVPMLAFPVTFDQPGNAARIVHHGLGLRGSIRSATSTTILEQVDHLMTNRGAYLATINRMARHFEEPTPLEEALDLLERVERHRKG